jgi:hypothetical protein
MSRSRHSGGVSSVQRTRLETKSSRSYPNMPRNASLASITRPFEIGNKDPDDVGVDQAPDLSFAIRKIAIKPRILEAHVVQCTG